MARAAKAAAQAAAPSENALIPWDEQLAKDAELAAGMEQNAGGGQFFSVKGGVLTFGDMPVPGNQMAVIILDTIFENVFYEGKYDPNNITPPTCFAFGHDEASLAPHKTVEEHDQGQHEKCQGCPMNAWGTADTGRGKACRNSRRMGMIPAGTLDPNSGQFKQFQEDEHFSKAPIGFLKLPVTSVKGYAGWVKQLAGTLKRPPHGIIAKVKVVPDATSQFKVVFEAISKVPDELMPIVMERRQEALATIEQPYNLDIEAAAPATAPARGKPSPAPKRPPVKKKY